MSPYHSSCLITKKKFSPNVTSFFQKERNLSFFQKERLDILSDIFPHLSERFLKLASVGFSTFSISADLIYKSTKYIGCRASQGLVPQPLLIRISLIVRGSFIAVSIFIIQFVVAMSRGFEKEASASSHLCPHFCQFRFILSDCSPDYSPLSVI